MINDWQWVAIIIFGAVASVMIGYVVWAVVDIYLPNICNGIETRNTVFKNGTYIEGYKCLK